jgi:hypothetical protein
MLNRFAPDPLNDPLKDGAVTGTFTCKPPSGEIDADALPDAICYRLRPTIADAGILDKSAPEPLNEPVNVPVKFPVNEPDGEPIGTTSSPFDPDFFMKAKPSYVLRAISP